MKKHLQGFLLIFFFNFFLPLWSFGFDDIFKESGSENSINLKINFQDQATNPPSGWLKDYGQPFGPRTGSTNDYGWKKRSDGTPVDLSIGGTAGNGRVRNTPSDILLATFMHMQGNDVANFNGNPTEGIWEMAVENGIYLVTVSVGDGVEVNSEHSINVEGINVINKFIPSPNNRFKNATLTVTVADGLLTIDAIGGTNTKINSVNIESVNEARPSILSSNPENNAENVSINTSISTGVLNLPHGAIDNSTISTTHVYLEELPSGNKVSANVNGTGGGDAITLVPAASLKTNTQYRFSITDGVKDVEGFSFIPFSMTFRTGTSTVGEIEHVQFEKIKQNASDNVKHTTLTIGPDGKLYGSTIDGRIRRYPIAADGTLGIPEIFLLKNIYNDTKERTIIGLTFDPAATAENLIVYITHSSNIFENAPNWDGNITRLSGPNLQTLQDLVINLPRSTKDHLTNSLVFGPDGAVYINQGSTSAMGAADPNWDNRPETLLSGSLLRLDLSKLTTLPLDAKTSDGGGNYNPYAANAPLTMYATGVRNAFDLVWHSNGQLYVPTNGSAPGGNTPASVNGTLRPDGTTYNGPNVPALNNINQVMEDFLFRVEQGGYYGHPNLLRGEYVLNGGNPTAGQDPAQINAYPVGTLPDVNYRGFAYDFSINKSANGVIEYKSNSFKGFLKGKLLVVRFSQNKDIITLTPGGPDLNIVEAIEGPAIPGFSGFIDPLDLVEDTRNGNIYVSNYIRNEEGEGYITLLKPIETITNIAPTISEIADQIIKVGENLGLTAFTIADEDDDVNDLQVSAISDNHELVPDENIAFGGSGADRTLTIAPVAGQAGSAVITVIVSDGYDETETSFTLTVEEVTSIDEEIKNLVVLYPNPTSSGIDLIIKNAVFGEVNIQVLDLRGRVYKSFTFNKQEEKMKLQLDLHELAKGSYIVQVKQNGPVSSKVIIKL
ncbi:hypothetical protein BH23BAC1_BH23BAC1_48570 [soil metagenome]